MPLNNVPLECLIDIFHYCHHTIHFSSCHDRVQTLHFMFRPFLHCQHCIYHLFRLLIWIWKILPMQLIKWVKGIKDIYKMLTYVCKVYEKSCHALLHFLLMNIVLDVLLELFKLPSNKWMLAWKDQIYKCRN